MHIEIGFSLRLQQENEDVLGKSESEETTYLLSK